jgi:hypothetical protein
MIQNKFFNVSLGIIVEIGAILLFILLFLAISWLFSLYLKFVY